MEDTLGLASAMGKLDELCCMAHELAEKYKVKESKQHEEWFVLFKECEGKWYYEGAYSKNSLPNLARCCLALGNSRMFESVTIVPMSGCELDRARENDFSCYLESLNG